MVMDSEYQQKIARMMELTGSIKKQVAELAASGEAKPDFLELIQLLSEHIDDPEVLEIIEELLASETDDEIRPPTAIPEIEVLDLPKQEKSMPYYSSAESLDAEIESAREIFVRDLQEAFTAANTFSDYLLEKIKTKKEQHPEHVAKETEKRGPVEIASGGTIMLHYNNIHHKPEEEVLGATLKLWGYGPHKANPIINEPYKPGGQKYIKEEIDKKLDQIRSAKDGRELIEAIKWNFFHSTIIDDLLRMQLLIRTYYPENKDYEKLLKPIDDLRQTLENLGFEIGTVLPLTEVTEKDLKETVDLGGFTAYWADESLNSLPTVYDKVNQKVEEAREGKKIAIDVTWFGFQHRFMKDIVRYNGVKLLSPSSWDDKYNLSRLGVIY